MWASPRWSVICRDEYEPIRDALHQKATEISFILREGTLFPFCVEFLSAQLLEDESEVVKLVFEGTREYHNVIDVDRR